LKIFWAIWYIYLPTLVPEFRVFEVRFSYPLITENNLLGGVLKLPHYRIRFILPCFL
jgi:hypothetical protein